MNVKKWLSQNTESLSGKKIAITGSTGGLGRELCFYMASLGASLVLVDRNEKLSLEHRESLIKQFRNAEIACVRLDLEDVRSAKSVSEELMSSGVDILIHNAGAYSIPRRICESGFDNVFQINFATPFYMIHEMLPYLREKKGKVVVVGSIAHNYSKINENDVDFSGEKASSKVYGNSKRYIMFSLYELFRNESEASLSVCHPGITFTNITAHYPKWIFAIIKNPMKIIFMKKKKAALSILKGVFDNTSYCEWIGPRLFDVWGYPKKKTVKTANDAEREKIFRIAGQVYERCKETADGK